MLRSTLLGLALAISHILVAADSSSTSTHFNTLDGGYQYLTELYNTLDGGYQWLTDITASTVLTPPNKDKVTTTYTTQSFTASDTNELTVTTATSTISGSAVVTTAPQYISWVTVTPTANGGSALPAVLAGVVIVPAMFEALQGVVDVSAGKSAVEIAEAIKNALEGKKITLTAEDLQKLGEYIKNAMVSAAAAGAVYKIGPLLKGATVALVGPTAGTTTSSDTGPTVTAIMKPPYDNWEALKNLPEPSGSLPTTDDGDGNTTPICKREGDNGNLSLDPSIVSQLVKKFCGSKDLDLTKDYSASLGGESLDPASTLDNHAEFKYTHTDGKCAKSCIDNFASVIQTCKFDSHSFNGDGSIADGCGTFAVSIAKGAPQSSGGTTSGAGTRKEWDTKCTDSSKYTKFTLDTVTKDIGSFCASGVKLLDAAQPVSNMYKLDGVVIHLSTQWSQSGQDGCAPYDKANTQLTKEECTTGFLDGVNNCNTDTATNKYGAMPITWSGPKGCVDFNVYADLDSAPVRFRR